MKSYYVDFVCPDCKSNNKLHILNKNKLEFKCYSCGKKLVYEIIEKKKGGANPLGRRGIVFSEKNKKQVKKIVEKNNA